MTTSLVRTRLATPHDVGAVTDLHARCSPDTLRRRFHVPGHAGAGAAGPRGSSRRATAGACVAEQCGEVVGLGSAGPLTADALEVGLLVEDRHQGTGVGSRMLRDAGPRRRTRAATGGWSAWPSPTTTRCCRPCAGPASRVSRSRSTASLEVVVPLPARRRGLRRPA